MSHLEMEFTEIPLADIETRAQKLIEDYEGHIGKRIRTPVPVESIAEHYLGYTIDITDEGLFEDPKYLGGIVFDEAVIRVNAAVESHEGRYNFTIAHEIGHHVLHREQFIAARSEQTPNIMCREVSAKPLEERQADQFASALLMPADEVAKAMRNIPSASGDISVRALRALAGKVCKIGGFSNVSNTAMCNRLITLGYARGLDYQTGTGLDLMRSADARGFSGIDTWLYKRLKKLMRIFR